MTMESRRLFDEARRARRGALGFTAGALVMTALLGFAVARTWDEAGGEPTTEIVVAARELPAFKALSAADLKLAAWPRDSAPEGAYKRVADVLASQRSTLRALLTGEPVLARRLSSPDEGVGVTQLIDPERRAFVLRVNESLAIAQLLQPGVVVDVVTTLRDPRTGETISKVALQALEILAVGPAFDASLAPEKRDDSERGARQKIERARVVTLLATPEQVEILAFATQGGSIDLALRNGLDRSEVRTGGVTRKSIFAGEPAEQRAPRSASHSRQGPPAIVRVTR